jgi:DNA-binding beta-propeller fold protein YncE
MYTLPKFDVAYDSALGYLYVAGFGSDNVTVISDKTNTVLTDLWAQPDPLFTAYDPKNGYVYVENHQVSSVTVLHGTSNVANVTTGANPRSALYDPANGYVYVANEGASNVTVLRGTASVANLSVGSLPTNVTYDPLTQDIYVCNSGGNTVAVFHNITFLANLTVGSQPASAIYDPANGYVYVPNVGSDNVSVLRGTTVLGNVSAGSAPGFGAYDPANEEVYVANAGSANVTVIQGRSVVANVPTGNGSQFVAYDPANSEVFVSNVAVGTVSVINGTNEVATVSVGDLPQMLTYDAANKGLYLPDEGAGNVSELGTPDGSFPVSFTEMGLPTPSNFSVQIGATLFSPPTPTMVVPEPNGTYGYAVTPVPGYYAVNGTGNVTVDGESANVTVTFEPTYLVTFRESGLPSRTGWNVTVGPTKVGSTSDNLTFEEPNGSFTYSVGFVPGYRPPSQTGRFSVTGTPTTVSLAFGVTAYPVTFNELGLPVDTPWQVTLAGQTKASAFDQIVLSAPNGTYPYSISAGPGYFTSNATGRLTVLSTGPFVNRTFVLAYPVVFHEFGLPTGTNWSVSIGSETNYSTAALIVLNQPNGTHTYVLGPVPGYSTAPTGLVTVDGASRSVRVNFTVAVYAVVFAEHGLPAGTPWGILFDGSPGSSTTKSMSFEIANGSFTYSVDRVAGFTPVNRSGTVVVAGVALLVNVSFLPTYPVTFHESGLAAGTNWSVTIGPDTNASTSASLVLDEPNGTFDYSVARIAGYTGSWLGTVRVSGARASVGLAFEAILYTLTFRASGLPYETHWQVSIGAATNGSYGTTVALFEPNGSYTYQVGIVPGYRASVESGRVSVDGSGSTTEVVFSPTTYAVVFEERGLPAGTSWSVRLGGTVENSTSSAISFLLANGTYNYTVLDVPGYGTPTPGSVVVAGVSPAPAVVTFAAPASGGWTAVDEYAIVGGAASAAVAVTVVAVWWRRRPREPPTGPAET